MRNVIFFGRKRVAARCLEWLIESTSYSVSAVVTDDHLSESVTASVARAAGLRVCRLDDIQNLVKRGEVEYDIGFSMLYWKRLHAEFLKSASHGFINFHPAPLPAYQGIGGYNLAVLFGLEKWGVTGHYMNELIDGGDIIKVADVNFDSDNDTALSLEALCQPVLYELFVEIASDIASGKKFVLTKNVGGDYYNRQQIEEMKIVREGDDVDRKIRAFWFPPYTGAVKYINGKPYTLVTPDILENLGDKQISNVWTKKK